LGRYARRHQAMAWRDFEIYYGRNDDQAAEREREYQRSRDEWIEEGERRRIHRPPCFKVTHAL
jgi:hypothetical protein